MGRHGMAAFLAVARCSPSKPMALVFRSCIVSRQPLFLLATLAGDIRMPDWSYRAAPFVERRFLGAPLAPALYSPSTPMARGLRPCIISLTAATELFR